VNNFIHQRCFAVVNVGNNGDVADVLHKKLNDTQGLYPQLRRKGTPKLPKRKALIMIKFP
jgi:hypothetical protein